MEPRNMSKVAVADAVEKAEGETGALY